MNQKLKKQNLTDLEILSGISDNSGIAINQLYQFFFPMVLRLVLNNNGSEHDAKDIFQESILVLYDKLKSENFQLTSKLKTFLYSVSRNLWLKQLSYRNQGAINLRNFESFLRVEEDLEEYERKSIHFQCMESSLDELGEPCRTIIDDYYIQNKSMEEIAARLQYTNADSAKTQKYKCLQRLKKIFFKQQKD